MTIHWNRTDVISEGERVEATRRVQASTLRRYLLMEEKGEKRVVRVRRSVPESTNWHVHESLSSFVAFPRVNIMREVELCFLNLTSDENFELVD